MSRLCIKGLAKGTTEKTIRDVFSSKGEVTDARIVKTSDGKSRRFAFVGFRTETQAKEALNYFNNTFLEAARISVEFAKKVQDMPSETSRSKHTQKKLEKLKGESNTSSSSDAQEKDKKGDKDGKNQDERGGKEKNKTSKSQDGSKTYTKEQLEFLEVMKPRKAANFWANDEAIDHGANPNPNPNMKIAKGHEDDSESDSDSYSDDSADNILINGKVVSAKAAKKGTISDKTKKITKEKEKEKVKETVKGKGKGRDRSASTSDESDSDYSSDDDADSEDEEEKEKETKKADTGVVGIKELGGKKSIAALDSISDLDYMRSKMSSSWSSSDDEGDDGKNKIAVKKTQANTMKEGKEEKEEDNDDKEDEEEEDEEEDDEDEEGEENEEEDNDDEDKEEGDHKKKKEGTSSKGDNDKNTSENKQFKDGNEDEDEDLTDTGRLFIRNLPFSCSEDELMELFQSFGPVTEVHLPLDSERKGKGFGFVQFMLPENANTARLQIDGTAFQGRLLHIIPAKRAREVDPMESASSGKGGSKLSSYQQKKEAERRSQAGRKEGWNASFVRSDAVIDSLSETLGVSKSEIMDTSQTAGEMAVRMALGEAHVIEENRTFFLRHGVDLNALESNTSTHRASKRSTTTILIKNLPHDMVDDEVESMFTRFGAVASFLVAPSKTLALVDFVEASEARGAFKGLAFRKYKHLPLYLEWAPEGVIDKAKAAAAKKRQNADNDNDEGGGKSAVGCKKKSKGVSGKDDSVGGEGGVNTENNDEYATLYIKNLAFATTEDGLRGFLKNVLGVTGLRAVSIPTRTKDRQVLSMGFGFAEFASPQQAADALKRINSSVLDGHSLEAKPSEKRLSTADKKSNKINPPAAAANNGTKLIVRNVAFQATPADIRSLFSAFGTVKRVRIPKKMGGTQRLRVCGLWYQPRSHHGIQ